MSVTRGLLALAGVVVSIVLLLSLLFIVAASVGWMETSWITGQFEALAERRHGRVIVGFVLLALLAADLVLPVPSSVLMTLAGFFLGVPLGTTVGFAGAMGSAIAGFWLCRRFGRRAFVRLVGDRDQARIEGWIDRYGAWAILLSRPVPMLTEVMSCVAGLGAMTFGRFVVLSAAGTLPICLVYAWAGSTSSGTSDLVWPLVVALGIPAVGFLVVRRLERDRRPK